ncbi:MAG: peptide deformylase [Pseudomonadota bacterium]
MSEETYELVKVPSDVLKQTAHAVEKIDSDIQAQIEKMTRTMYRDSGIGLAANQVGILNRIFVMDLPDHSWEFGEEKDGVHQIIGTYRSGESEFEPGKNLKAFINPEIVSESQTKSVYEEGCLSIPGAYAEVVRPSKVKVRYQNEQGSTVMEEFEGLHAHCVQHEIDHLNGVLFIDYLSSLKRNMILKKMKKLNKDASVL